MEKIVGSSKSVNGESVRNIGETSNPTMDKCQEDRGERSFNEETWNDKKIDTSVVQGSPELRRKVSRTMAVRDDARRLKTATLDRMGKIFKLKSSQATSSTDDQLELPDSTMIKDPQDDEQTRKNKTNSLGRMFKLVSKKGEPRKLFQQSRTGSLSRMLRRKSTGTNEDNETGSENRSSVFSRMFSQWKHRSGNGNPTAEPNLCDTSMIQENTKSQSAKQITTSRMNLSPSSTELSKVSTLPATSVLSDENFTNVEYSA